MAIRAARWNTRSCPRMAVRTPLGSRTSPIKISISLRISGGRVSIQPREPNELYRQKARTFSPLFTSSSARWLPIKPSAPVTITVWDIVKTLLFIWQYRPQGRTIQLLQNSITDLRPDFNQCPAQRAKKCRGCRGSGRPALNLYKDYFVCIKEFGNML